MFRIFTANHIYMAQFASKLGLIAATVGSAVGLGNVWRFPAEAQANGGGAFLIVYLFCVLLLGIPAMLGEFAIGRNGATDAVGAYKKIASGKSWWIVGMIGIVASFMILCFYTVVTGWTLEYMINSLTGSLYSNVGSSTDADTAFVSAMREYVESDWQPLIYTFITLVITGGVLMMGVEKGIERVSNVMMPALFLLLLIFCISSLTLPGASDGVEFFLWPDFSKITPMVVINALGQAFFSLSLGMGVLYTYAGYFPKQTKLAQTATTVSLLDLLVSVMMGLIIFPAVASFGMMGSDLEGTTLVFITLPEIFQQMPATRLWSVLFFMLLLFAALTSVISIAEVSVRLFQDRMKMSRFKAVLTVLIPLLIFSSMCSLSQGSLSDIKLFGLTIFSLFDTFASNILLPTGSLLMCIYIGWFAPRNLMPDQLTNHGTLRSIVVRPVMFLIKWVAPIAIFIILISPLIK